MHTEILLPFSTKHWVIKKEAPRFGSKTDRPPNIATWHYYTKSIIEHERQSHATFPVNFHGTSFHLLHDLSSISSQTFQLRLSSIFSWVHRGIRHGCLAQHLRLSRFYFSTGAVGFLDSCHSEKYSDLSTSTWGPKRGSG